MLYAIREGVYRIVEMLIEHPTISRDMLGSEWARKRHVTDESFDYSPDISPGEWCKIELFIDLLHHKKPFVAPGSWQNKVETNAEHIANISAVIHIHCA